MRVHGVSVFQLFTPVSDGLRQETHSQRWVSPRSQHSLSSETNNVFPPHHHNASLQALQTSGPRELPARLAQLWRHQPWFTLFNASATTFTSLHTWMPTKSCPNGDRWSAHLCATSVIFCHLANIRTMMNQTPKSFPTKILFILATFWKLPATP